MTTTTRAFKRTCMCNPLPIPRTTPSDGVKQICEPLVLSDETLNEVATKFRIDLDKGLAKNTHPTSIVKCFITYVQSLPNGSEVGKYLALDLGGTNFRCILVELTENHFEMRSKVFELPATVIVGPGDGLFDHIAECLYKFERELNLLSERLALAFTFSFPLRQIGLKKGILETWTKGFDCPDVVNDDVVERLIKAIDKRGDLQLDVVAVLNDTTGTLMSCAWKAEHCTVGLIMGTGSNACYYEKQSIAELFDEPDVGTGKVIINCEWGAFGNDGTLDFIRTPYDIDVDDHSVNPKGQLHEKMISGMYLGELVRLCMVHCCTENKLLNGDISAPLSSRDVFKTKFLSQIEVDPPGKFDNCKKILQGLGYPNPSEQDMRDVRYICECVSRRSAFLCSAALSVILNKMGDKRVTIGIDGSLYRFHPHFHNLMMEQMTKMVEKDIVFDLMLSEDGSGRGAALVAAVAAK